MPYLFDTDAISEVYKPRPNPRYLSWLRNVPRSEQLTSAIVVGELFGGAFLSQAREKYLTNIRDRLLAEVTVLPFDVGCAEIYGRMRAELQAAGRRLPDADLQIAATAMAHRASLVTGNVRHHARISGLEICHALADARRAGS